MGGVAVDGVRYCPRCGRSRPPESRFCANCGTDFLGNASRAEPGSRVPAVIAVSSAGHEPTRVAKGPAHTSRPLLRRVGYLIVPVFVIVLALVSVLGWLAYSADRELSRVREELAATTVTLSSETSNRRGIETRAADLQNRVTTLESALSKQTDCTTQLSAEIGELSRIEELSRLNFNRFAKGSKWTVADVLQTTALLAATDDYYQAYRAAFAGRLSSANAWAAKGNAQIKKANAQVAILNGEIKAGNDATAVIESAIAALDSRTVATKNACSSSGTL
jgi:septal ring factor EnvC (AmiA/AmiB activator)